MNSFLRFLNGTSIKVKSVFVINLGPTPFCLLNRLVHTQLYIFLCLALIGTYEVHCSSPIWSYRANFQRSGHPCAGADLQGPYWPEAAVYLEITSPHRTLL